MKTIYVSKPIPISFDIFLAVAAVLRFLNRNHDDYDIRLEMGELTREEARRAVLADIANEQKHIRDAVFWGGG